MSANMLVIHPDECIVAAFCEPECPADAILRTVKPGRKSGWRSIGNTLGHGRTSPAKGRSACRRRQVEGVADKFDKHFSPNPGKPWLIQLVNLHLAA